MQSSVVLDPGIVVARFCTGAKEISRLTELMQITRSALGRRGAEANDARAGEVRLGHSSCEVGEQFDDCLVCQGKQDCASRCGVDGAKAWGQGERESIEQAPDAEPQRFAFPPSARVCPNDWIVYEREQKAIRQNDLRRCCTTLRQKSWRWHFRG